MENLRDPPAAGSPAVMPFSAFGDLEFAVRPIEPKDTNTSYLILPKN